MSQQLRAGCCCGEVEPPPCQGQPCEIVVDAGQDPVAYYTVTNAGWSVSFSAVYYNLDFALQSFEFTVTIPAETYNYFPNQQSTPDGCPWPVPLLTDFSGPLGVPEREPYWTNTLFIENDVNYNVPDSCLHRAIWSVNAPFEIEPPNGGPIAEWYLAGPQTFFFRWARAAPNTCTRRPHSGIYQVESVGFLGIGGNAIVVPNGTCIPFDPPGFSGTEQVCVSATPIVLDVRECQ
jgi:hypothetical protein